MDRRKALRQTGLFAGAVVLAPNLMMLLDSCKRESKLTWKPVFLDEMEVKTVSKLVDKILPRTETPGALDMNVDIFIDKFFNEVYDSAAKETLRQEIEAFNSNCISQKGDIFPDLNDEDTQSIMEAAEAASADINPDVWGTTVGEQKPVSFYKKLKSIAIWAYFTSTKIGEEVLSYDPLPGGYEGSKPVSEVGNRWSL